MSSFLALIGEGPKGTLLGQIEYLVQSNDNADIVSSDDEFKYIDDLSVLTLILLSGLLVEYDFHSHIPSDIGTEEKFLPPESYAVQNTLNSISDWTKINLMKLNPAKCKYMIFSRSGEKFTTRLKLDDMNLERANVLKILGLYITENLSWSKNCSEICRKAYSRMQLITKLKYVGVKTEDLIEVYVLYIRSLAEYCSVAFHPSLTIEQSNKIERIQRTALKIILGDMYIDYSAALEMSSLDTLYARRTKRCLDFALKSTKHIKNQRMFPPNEQHCHSIRNSEKYKVNYARTSRYLQSTIPYCQRLLNKYSQEQ